MSYRHSGPGPGGPPPPPQKIDELLEYVRQEFQVTASEAHHAKVANGTTAQATLKEIEALRHSYTELEREHVRAKDQYEDEIHRLRRELEMRGAPSSMQQVTQSPLPPPQVGLGQANLFGDLTNPARSQPPPPNLSTNQHPQHPPPTPPATQPHEAYPQPAAYPPSNGWERERESERLAPLRDRELRETSSHQLREHPAKRLRLDEQTQSQPAQTPYAGSAGRGNGAPQVGHHAHNAEAGKALPTPTPLNPLPPAYTGSKPSSNQSQIALFPPTAASKPASTPMAPTESESSAAPLAGARKEGADWVVMHNPKVARKLDVELTHTLMHDSVVCCVKFSPDGRTLATGCNRNTVLYDTKTGAKISTLVDGAAGPKDDNYIRSACFSPDGKFLATGSEDRKIRIWDIARKSIKTTLEGHKNEIYSLIFSPDGKLLYSGSGDQTTRMWDMETGECLHVLQAEESAAATATASENGQPVDAGVTSVALSSDGRLLAAGSLDTNVRLWDARKGTLLDKLTGHKDSVYSVAFGPDGKWLVSGSLDKTLKLWDLTALRLSLSRGSGTPSATEGEEKKPVIESAEGVTSERSVTCISTLVGHKDYVLSVAVAPDGPWIVSGSKDRGVSFWEPGATAASIVLQGHKNSVISIAVSDQGGLLATGSGDWLCRLWRFSSAAAA